MLCLIWGELYHPLDICELIIDARTEHLWVKVQISRCKLLKWFPVFIVLRMLTSSGKRPGVHCTGVCLGPRVGLDGCGKSNRTTENLVDLPKISQNFRKSRENSENLAELPKMSLNFSKSCENSENLAEVPTISLNFRKSGGTSENLTELGETPQT